MAPSGAGSQEPSPEQAQMHGAPGSLGGEGVMTREAEQAAVLELGAEATTNICRWQPPSHTTQALLAEPPA